MHIITAERDVASARHAGNEVVASFARSKLNDISPVIETGHRNNNAIHITNYEKLNKQLNPARHIVEHIIIIVDVDSSNNNFSKTQSIHTIKQEAGDH
jgi:hypothetical protein